MIWHVGSPLFFYRKEKEMEVRKRLHFYGTVQGVGFRYRSCYIAKSLSLIGYVKNCYDGSVEMEVQGREEQIDKLLVRLDEEPFIVIERLESEDIPLESGYDFEVYF